ncbi:MAG: preprotein translocase subunit YajC [Clostridia bacterium]|jgi:preprotein translocase subunit YajC|nr:preprotein translocase subunit YajC [Clostridia bacterium]
MSGELLRLFGTAVAETAAAGTAAAGAAAGDAAAAAEGAAVSGPSAFIYYAVQLAPMILIFVVFYFILIRPQRKKDKEAKAMLANLKVGDNICTIGGIHAKITGIKDDTLYIEVGRQKAELVIARWAVRNVEELSVTNDSENLI